MKQEYKVVFAGSPDFALPVLEKLFNSDEFKIELVISQEDKKRNRGKIIPTSVKSFAISNNLRVHTPKNVNDDETYALIDEINPDFMVVVAFGQIIGKRLLDRLKDKIVNVHASLLPQYRGASPINAAILNGEKVSGISIMMVEKGLDTGDVLYEVEVEIAENDDCLSLSEKLSFVGADAIIEVLKNFEKYFFKRKKQNDSEASYAGLIKKEMGLISWEDTAFENYNKVRGLKVWPGAFFGYDDVFVKVYEAEIGISKGNFPGELISISDEGIEIACTEGSLILKKIQFPNKKIMEVSDYLKGNKFLGELIRR